MQKEIIVGVHNMPEAVGLIAATLPQNADVSIRNVYVENLDDAISLLKLHAVTDNPVFKEDKVLMSFKYRTSFFKDSVKIQNNFRRPYEAFIGLKGNQPWQIVIDPADKVIILSEAIYIFKNDSYAIGKKKSYIQALEFIK